MAVPISEQNLAELVEPGIRKVFFNSYDETVSTENMVPRLFNMQGTNRLNEYTLSMSALGDLEDFDATGQINYDDIEEGYKQTFTQNGWAKGIRVTRKMMKYDLYGVMNKMPSQRGIAAARTKEKHGISLFNGAFAGTGGADSVALCSSAHPSPVDGVSNQSNTGTDTLNKTTVSSTRLSMKKLYGLNGERIGVKGDMILTGMDKEQDAWEVISSKGEPETDNNNRNFHFGKYKLAVSDEITSTFNWFFIDARLMKQDLLWFTGEQLQLNRDTAFNTYEARFSAFQEYAYGYSDYVWIYGHNATS